MKKIILFAIFLGTITLTSCSKDNDDSDAIVGTWVSESSVSINGGEEQTERDVWKFNADNTGSYSESSNGTMDFTTDFVWAKNASEYEVNYSDEEVSTEVFTIGELLGNKTLETDGEFIAVKE